MIAQPEGPLTRTGMCWFGLQQLPPRLAAFEKEIEGVRKADDIEYIHRMRVASRRLRAALPLFRTCFPRKQYRKWMEEIANITRALGEARDADVQIAFLEKQIKKISSAKKNNRVAQNRRKPGAEPALRYLLAELTRKREQLQDRVISALDALEKSRVIPEMKTYFSAAEAVSGHPSSRSLMYGITPVSALQISTRLDAMLAYEPWVRHPDAVAEHHATRIAAKKLRYTIELFGPVYRLGLKKALARTKKIQEILGDIHDCDVWIDTIARILLRERSRLRTDNEEKRPDPETLSSLRILLSEREKARDTRYRIFVRNWEAQKRAGLWDDLRRDLELMRKRRFRPKAETPAPEALEAVASLSSIYPEGLAHHDTVTRLALMLFDSLKPMHNLGDRERFLLESAARLHDIGWIGGPKRHNRRGAALIYTAETLPLDIRERAIIALGAKAHRGRAPVANEPLFQLLPEKEQKIALRIAALLRIADGLDYAHRNSVEEIHCVIGPDRITADAVSPQDITLEKEHARIKSNLFLAAFARDLVIR